MENVKSMDGGTTGCVGSTEYGDGGQSSGADLNARWDFPVRRVLFHDVDVVAKKRRRVRRWFRELLRG